MKYTKATPAYAKTPTPSETTRRLLFQGKNFPVTGGRLFQRAPTHFRRRARFTRKTSHFSWSLLKAKRRNEFHDGLNYAPRASALRDARRREHATVSTWFPEWVRGTAGGDGAVRRPVSAYGSRSLKMHHLVDVWRLKERQIHTNVLFYLFCFNTFIVKILFTMIACHTTL